MTTFLTQTMVNKRDKQNGKIPVFLILGLFLTDYTH